MALLAAWLCVVALPVRADIYRFTDSNGLVHYTNVEPKGGAWLRMGQAASGQAHASAPPLPCNKDGPLDPDGGTQFDSPILEAAQLYQLPEPFVRAVILVESNFCVDALSDQGAMGLMQLMPDKATEMGTQNAFDPRQNILGGTRYLRELANQFNGDLVLTVAAYQAGADEVDKWRGVPPSDVTRRFVRAVLHYYYAFRGTAGPWSGIHVAMRPARHRLPTTALFARLADSVFMVTTPAGVQGSAVAVTSTLLVTNAHVVNGQTEVTLVQGKSERTAWVTQTDAAGDRAILEVSSLDKLRPVPGVRPWSNVAIGERVYSLGYPMAGATFADGLVSGVRTIPRQQGVVLRLLQTSAPISPGSSGGGLFDAAGNLVGVTTLFIENAQNLNGAIIMDDFFASGAVRP